jgi:hypothetical protein
MDLKGLKKKKYWEQSDHIIRIGATGWMHMEFIHLLYLIFTMV